MNDTAADYSWPTCMACGHELWVSEAGRQACRPCEDKTVKRLAELPSLFRQLNTTASLMRGARKVGAATSGSRVPPIPPRLEVLSLVAAGGVATRLRDIEDSWRAALGWTVAPWRGSPAEAVPEHTRFLINNLPWAADAYDSIDQDIDDIRRLHVECDAALTGERRPGRVNVGLCPVADESGKACGNQLTASAGSPRIQCGTCGTEWSDMAAWRDLRRAQEAANETGAAA
ncbi:hypothetical protein AB0G60_02655 [Streptomyces angustmyceticus]|uniref:Uncharacterized protein n=1 Tax=Streptomyces angustmyceticus TaxID=285578 RepID=A0A5J4L0J2_9ACTN|nr:hypothetical protein [Streptomyces angustmyceticus]UAL65564.1 hypothetical protein K7396_02630 [Streptomyces angustmyceticus]GES27917.1 hypothetical protein San01_04040 [Streptomyces angustmyceticus]